MADKNSLQELLNTSIISQRSRNVSSFHAPPSERQTGRSVSSNIQSLRSASTTNFGNHLTSTSASSIGGYSREGVVELTKSTKYCVVKLPASPTLLNSDRHVIAMLDQSTSYGILLTEQAAHVWDYTAPDHIPDTLLFGSASATYPPLATLVSPPPGSKEPGLLMVIPNTGLVTYWETIGGAVADGLLNRRKSIEHKIKLYASEGIDNFVNAEPAGIVITTTSGRFILLCFRDMFGKPLLYSETMRGSGAGIFASLKDAITPVSGRRGIVSIKKGVTKGKGHRQMFFINTTGNIYVWDVLANHYGPCRKVLEERLWEVMVNQLTQMGGIYTNAAESLFVHDLEYFEAKNWLFLLTSFVSNFDTQETLYLVFCFTLGSEISTTLVSTYRFQSYTMPSMTQPQLCFPSPYNTLFVVLSHAVLLLDAFPDYTGMMPRWEDVISFRSQVEVYGSGKEDLIISDGKVVRHSGIVIATSSGILRIERYADEEEEDKERKERGSQSIEGDSDLELARSKILQAVFFGYLPDETLDFRVGNAVTFKPEVLEEALLSVSNEILDSTSVYLPQNIPNLSDHIANRVQCLKNLSEYLSANFVEEVSVRTRLELMWDLEHAVAAQNLWAVLDSKLSDQEQQLDGVKLITNSDASLLTKVIFKLTNTNDAETLRNWFRSKMSELDKLLIESSSYCVNTFGQANGNRAQTGNLGILFEANSILLDAVMDSAFEVRREYMKSRYFLNDHDTCDISPWTSSFELIKAFESQYHLTSRVLNNLNQGRSSGSDGPDWLEFRKQLVSLVFTLCSLYRERIFWSSNMGPSYSQQTLEITHEYEDRRGKWLQSLVEVSEKSKALEIAELFAIHRSLAEILLQGWISDVRREGQTSNQKLVELPEDIQFQLNLCIKKFGYEFASVLFEYLIETKQSSIVLTSFPEYTEYLDRIFASGRYKSISWINDLNRNRFDTASKTLLTLSERSDGLTNDKRLYLSIAKLSTLAADIPEDAKSRILTEVKVQSNVITVQGLLYDQMATKFGGDNPEGGSGRMNIYSDSLTKTLHTRQQQGLLNVLQRALSRLAQQRSLSVEELVDITTLVDTNEIPSTDYALAIQLIASNLQGSRKTFYEKIFWRRAFINDNWNIFTQGQSDSFIEKAVASTILHTILINIDEGMHKYHSLAQLYFQLLTYTLDLITASRNYFTDLSLCLFSESTQEVSDRFPYASNSDVSELIKNFNKENEILKDLERQYTISNWIKGIYSSAGKSLGDDVMEE